MDQPLRALDPIHPIEREPVTNPVRATELQQIDCHQASRSSLRNFLRDGYPHHSWSAAESAKECRCLT